MARVLEGIRVLDVTQWAFVPSAGGVLADWGATVLKVEHPEQGDPLRGLLTSGLMPTGGGNVNFMWELPNRGKRSVGIDLANPDGREVVHRLAATCDVFLTSFLPDARRRLGIDVDDIRAVNPKIIYARGQGQGTEGPEAEKGGYDSASFWARGGVQMATTAPGSSMPTGMPGAAYGDLTSGMTLAGGVAAALLHRERTGEAVVVDVSLLGMSMWAMSPGITAAKLYGMSGSVPLGPRAERAPSGNPLVNIFRTQDDRFVNIVFLQPDKFWPEFCGLLGRPDLVDDPRFADARVRAENSVEVQQIIDDEFAKRPLAEWKEILDRGEGVWAVAQLPGELHDDRQARANGFLRDIDCGHGETLTVVASPVVFDGEQPDLARAPELGEHTDETLLELGYDWDALIALKEKGAIY
jgi:crotonobetainyl-CoA:carnitine CoA-transferase CaiB-like acyl-CoA transferase